jgi:hypothetical protein
MNERIRDFANQAFDKVANEDSDSSRWFLKYSEEFAKLIIKECAQVCSDQRDPANLNYKPSAKFAEAIKQHFGVTQ